MRDSSTSKARYFCFEVYEDSAPSDWVDQLRASHGSYAISPLHTPEGGKPHWHVMYKHGTTCLLSCAMNVIPKSVPANGHVEVCNVPRQYMRYLCHMDDPDKQQFDGDPRDLIQTLGGFPLDLSRDFTASERSAMRQELCQMIRENGITEYADLIFGLLDAGKYDLFDYASSQTVFFTHVLSSVRHGWNGVPRSEDD